MFTAENHDSIGDPKVFENISKRIAEAPEIIERSMSTTMNPWLLAFMDVISPLTSLYGEDPVYGEKLKLLANDAKAFIPYFKTKEGDATPEVREAFMKRLEDLLT